jgi:hypothetical protein
MPLLSDLAEDAAIAAGSDPRYLAADLAKVRRELGEARAELALLRTRGHALIEVLDKSAAESEETAAWIVDRDVEAAWWWGRIQAAHKSDADLARSTLCLPPEPIPAPETKP